MEFRRNLPVSSPSSSASEPNSHPAGNNASPSSSNQDPMHSWWESVSKARSRILSLCSLLPSSAAVLSSVAESDHPARSLLASYDAHSALSTALSSPLAGSGSDPLCHWLYDAFQSTDPDLRLVVLSVLPLLTALYLCRVFSSSNSDPPPSLSGFEAVLLSVYASETKARAGKPVLITIPDLSQPCLYCVPQNPPGHTAAVGARSGPSVRVVSPPLEPQIAVKSTKRACIIGVALDSYYKQISQLPSWSKREFCQFAAEWAGQHCPCRTEFDETEVETDGVSKVMDADAEVNGHAIDRAVVGMGNLQFEEHQEKLMPAGVRIPLPWELFQPILRIMGHCLLAPLNSQDVKAAASVAVRCLYARASHDLLPQAVLATRSLIQLDNRRRATAKAAAVANASNSNTPSKSKKPEILLVSK